MQPVFVLIFNSLLTQKAGTKSPVQSKVCVESQQVTSLSNSQVKAPASPRARGRTLSNQLQGLSRAGQRHRDVVLVLVSAVTPQPPGLIGKMEKVAFLMCPHLLPCEVKSTCIM